MFESSFFFQLSRTSFPVAANIGGRSHGYHPGKNRGAGLEFSEYRRYEIGDDLRRLDWKLLGRSDRYFVREAERDTQVPFYFVLDSSKSMSESCIADRSAEEAKSRLTLALQILAGLGYIATRQADEIGLVSLSDQGSCVLSSQRGTRAFRLYLSQLQQVIAAGSLPEPNEFRMLFSALKQKGVCVFVSDFLDDAAWRWLKYLHAAKHQVYAVCLTSMREQSFLGKGIVNSVSEDNQSKWIDYEHQRSAYLGAYNEHFQGLRAWCQARNIRWYESDINSDPIQIIQALAAMAVRGGAR